MRRPLAAAVVALAAVLMAGCGHPTPKPRPTAPGVPASCAHTATAEPGKCAPAQVEKAIASPASAAKPPVAAEKATARSVVPGATVSVSRQAAAATPRAVAASLSPRARLIARRDLLRALEHKHSCLAPHPAYRACRVWIPEGRALNRRINPPHARPHKPKPAPKPAPKPRPRPVVVLRKVVDLSNNDPATYSQLAAMKRAGVQGVILKVNQGTTFADWTFAGMAQNARRLGLAVCGYDFVANYTAAEAYKFVGLLHTAGIWPSTRNTCPPTLDVEYGNATRAGVQNMAQIIWRSYRRAQVYTGNWYWSRLGCWWPYQVKAWLSGYPTAPVPCGLPRSLYVMHQFTDRGYNGAFDADLSWFQGTTSQWRRYIQAR